jgi:hypothetical protein
VEEVDHFTGDTEMAVWLSSVATLFSVIGWNESCDTVCICVYDLSLATHLRVSLDICRL